MPDQKKSIENQPSETALITASMRALTTYDTREEIRGRDYLAEIFLTEERKKALKDPQSREWILKNGLPAGLYEYIIARTAYFDSIVNNSLKENIPQLVFLGAGYDSRPYRFIEHTKSTKIFELDAKLTQERKIALLKESKISIPKKIAYVAINFDTDDIEKELIKAGYDKEKRTLFIWEGVVFYLSEQAIKNTLSFVANYSPPGSYICFDYQTYSQKENNLIKTKETVEKIKFGIEEGKLMSYLPEKSFKIIDHITANDMEKKYLTLNTGEKIGNILPVMNFVYASVIGT